MPWCVAKRPPCVSIRIDDSSDDDLASGSSATSIAPAGADSGAACVPVFLVFALVHVFLSRFAAIGIALVRAVVLCGFDVFLLLKFPRFLKHLTTSTKSPMTKKEAFLMHRGWLGATWAFF